MKRSGWIGWLLAGLLLLQNATAAFSAAPGANPLEGHLLQHTTGTFYVYHGGLKFVVQLADLGDQVIDAIPAASTDQWQTFFDLGPALRPLQLP